MCRRRWAAGVLHPGGTWRSLNTLATPVLIPIFTPVQSPRAHSPSPGAGLRSRRAPRKSARPSLPFSWLCWRRRGPRPAPCRHPPPLPAGIGPVPEERRRPPQRPQEGRRRRAPQAMPLPGCSGGGRCERRRGSWRGAAAAAAAAEGPRAGGGGGREGHR